MFGLGSDLAHVNERRFGHQWVLRHLVRIPDHINSSLLLDRVFKRFLLGINGVPASDFLRDFALDLVELAIQNFVLFLPCLFAPLPLRVGFAS